MAAVSGEFVFFHSARRVIHAPGAIGKLADLAKEFGCARAILAIDAVFAGGPIEARAIEALKAGTGVAPAVVHVPSREPDTASIEAVARAFAAADPDMIVAVGGGSTMDTAKVARLLLSNPGPAEGISGFGKTLRPHASLFVCAPTTAGTGSEVSESAISSKSGAEVKLIYRSPEMTAKIALLDPALTVGAPAFVTAQSGYDAVTHAVEAYVSNAASVMTDPLAVESFRLLARWLPVAYREPENLEARSACLIASCQAAIAFNSANLGLAHAFAAPLGALHHVAHGLGNALALPVVTAFNAPVLGRKGEVVAEAFGAASAAQAMGKIRAAVGLDVSIDKYVPDAEARAKVAAAAMRSGQVRMNPRLATLDDALAMIEAMRTPTGGDAPAFAR
ncbi:MAG: iron-containing alcohol dehydrogenase family protein [Tagaea sp.]